MEAWVIAGLFVCPLAFVLACWPPTAQERQGMKDWIHSWNWDTPDWDGMP